MPWRLRESPRRLQSWVRRGTSVAAGRRRPEVSARHVSRALPMYRESRGSRCVIPEMLEKSAVAIARSLPCGAEQSLLNHASSRQIGSAIASGAQRSPGCQLWGSRALRRRPGILAGRGACR